MGSVIIQKIYCQQDCKKKKICPYHVGCKDPSERHELYVIKTSTGEIVLQCRNFEPIETQFNCGTCKSTQKDCAYKPLKDCPGYILRK